MLKWTAVYHIRKLSDVESAPEKLKTCCGLTMNLFPLALYCMHMPTTQRIFFVCLLELKNFHLPQLVTYR